MKRLPFMSGRFQRGRRKSVMNSAELNPSADPSIPLCDLSPGSSGEILTLGGDVAFQSRLRNIGLREGVQVEMIKQAPLADPLEYRIGAMHVSLRRHEAVHIMVQPN
jgi:ferrous iron transport protein A